MGNTSYKMKNIRDKDVEDNTEKLCDAIDDGNTEVVEEILSNKEVDINGLHGLSPLICAVNRGHFDILRRLLEEPEIELGRCDTDGDTALHVACEYNRVSIVKLLCQVYP